MYTLFIAASLINSTYSLSIAFIHSSPIINNQIKINKVKMNASSPESGSWSAQATYGSSVSSTEADRNDWDDTVETQKGNYYVPDPPKAHEFPHLHAQAFEYLNGIVQKAQAAKCPELHASHDPQKGCDCDKNKIHTGTELLEQTWKLDLDVKHAADQLLRKELERNDLLQRYLVLHKKRSIQETVRLHILDCRMFDAESGDEATLARWQRSLDKAQINTDCAEDNLEKSARDFWMSWGEDFEDKPTLGKDVQEWFLKQTPEHKQQAAVDAEVLEIFLQRMMKPGSYMEKESEADR